MNTQIWHFEWKDELKIGAPEIDQDHQEAINLISELIEATLEMERIELILEKMQRVLDHTQRHFTREEEFLRQWCYPDITRHALEHEAIMRRFAELMTSIGNNTAGEEWTVVALHVRNTLIDHFLSEDLKFKDLHRAARAPSSAESA